jgi:zinc protease
MFKRIINIVVAFLLLLSIGFAQSKLDRSKAPIPDKPKSVTFPKFQESTLSNGLNLIVVENHKFPTVFISFTFKGGSYYDEDKVGLSTITSELLIKGTPNRTAMQIANEVDFLGSNLNSSSTWDMNRLTMRSLKKNLSQSLEILSDCILNPSFTEEELQREVAQMFARIKNNKTQPDYLAETQFSKVVFGDEHPYGKVSTEASLSSITVADLKNFYSKYFIPNNSYCLISGDIILQEAVSLLEEKLKDWKEKSSEKQKDNITPNFPSIPKVVLVEKTDAVQSAVRVGCVGIARTNPDYLKLVTLNVYLGGYFRSQLSQKLREEKSYTYGVSSGFDARLQPGPFAVRTSVASEVTAPAIEDILEEIKKLSTSLIPDDRFNEVKNYMMGSFPISIQTNTQVASSISNLKLYGLPMDYYDNYISNIQKITREDLKQVAEKYLDVSKLSIVVSGDNKTVAPTLSEFGNVESVDADGNPIK